MTPQNCEYNADITQIPLMLDENMDKTKTYVIELKWDENQCTWIIRFIPKV